MSHTNYFDCHFASIKDRLKPREKKIVDVSKRGYRKKEEKK